MRNLSSFLLYSKLKRCQSLLNHRLLPLPVTFEPDLRANLCPDNMIFSSFLCRKQGSRFCSTLQNADSLRKTNENCNGTISVEILSVENIKPSAPTPQHLKAYEVSLIDQFITPLYVPFVYFYPNNDCNGIPGQVEHDVITKRRKNLKQSLSETLTRFYPLAGKFKGARFIDCNDEGVYYAEAKVSERMSEFLVQPTNKSLHKLLPFVPTSMEVFSQTYMVMVQATVFGCGGISIGIYTSHKIIDGFSHSIFFNAWAATARGSLEDSIIPSFSAPSVFLPDPTHNSEGLLEIFPDHLRQVKSVTRRFVFSNSSLETLKKKADASSRVMGVASLIWRCAMDAAMVGTSSDGWSAKFPSSFLLMTDLRRRTLPPFPPFSIGNIISIAIAQSSRDDYVSGGLKLAAGKIKHSVDSLNYDYTDKLKGLEGSKKLMDFTDEWKRQLSNKNGHRLLVTSMYNSGLYEADFGWGKPIWACVADGDADIALLGNMVYLMETRAGRGIEAWVTLSEGEMADFEHNENLLSYASLNPSPLQTIS